MFNSFFKSRVWAGWAYGMGAILLAGLGAQVWIDVAINDWFGSFYDLIQTGLAKPQGITLHAYWRALASFAKLSGVYVAISVGLGFLTKHWIFRWRTAMSQVYATHWPALRHIEGAAQRVQEDTMRFASLCETLGINLVRCLMTLIAFLPVLAALSKPVTHLPWIGHLPYPLIWVALIFAVGGTVLIAFVGRKLPSLEFNNQRVEAAYRKELVLGEEHADAAAEPLLAGLYRAIRTNYMRLYLHFMYLDLTRYSYLQVSALLPYIALGPTLVAGGLTLGVMQQIVRAFGKVENAMQYLINNWGSVVELISVYQRLRSFERSMVSDARQTFPAAG